MGIVKEFREFALKGNVIDMAVGIIIGGAFGTVVNSLVKDVMMPPLGYLMGQVDFSALSLKMGTNDAGAPLVEMRYGAFINATISFLIVAFAVFMLVKGINTARKQFEKAQEAAPPPGPTADQKLLTEIRDLLASRR
ncbi:MAG TPA: large conductance mechanosensitive channel protein MscL [Phycisphaerales bacterium]|nr:large conductance mechanosensitive channel protein MscL [Phycisphaerales bacterium]